MDGAITETRAAPLASDRSGQQTRRLRRPWLILVGLVAGLVAGALIEASGSPPLQRISVLLEPIGTLWVNAISMTVIPMLISLIVTAVAAQADTASATRQSARSVMLFAGMIALSMVFALATAPLALAPLPLDAGTADVLRARAFAAAPATSAPSFRDWLVSVVPPNPIRAAAEGALLPVVLFSLLLGLAACRIASDQREIMVRFFAALRDSLFVLIRWILAVGPIGVFALALPLTARLGAGVAGAIGYFTLISCVLLAAATGLLYVLVALGGGVPLGRFVRACAPAQVVAIGTRSSLASLPALLESARRLELPAAVAGVTIPLAVAAFKYGSPVARITGTMFVAKLYGIELGTAAWLALCGALFVVPFYAPGIPSGGLLVMAPVYLAVGLPLEGLGLLIAVDPIPDMFLTACNVTADLTAATLLSRTPARVERAAALAGDV
jgi:Na+/H+-dicarboxylate symporter